MQGKKKKAHTCASLLGESDASRSRNLTHPNLQQIFKNAEGRERRKPPQMEVRQGKPPGSSPTLVLSEVPGSGRIRPCLATPPSSHCNRSITIPYKRQERNGDAQISTRNRVTELKNGPGDSTQDLATQRGVGKLEEKEKEGTLPSKDSPRAAGRCSRAAVLTRGQAIENGRVQAAQAVPHHRTQVWHCMPRMAA